MNPEHRFTGSQSKKPSMSQPDTSTFIGRQPVLEALEREDLGIEKVMLEQDASGERIGEIGRAHV